MLKTLFAICLTSTMMACGNNTNTEEAKTTNGSALNTLTASEEKEGWKLLFDGKTMNGWHRYGNLPVGSAWKVADGTFYLDTLEREGWKIKDGGDIATDEEYENFHLKLEWKISEGGNSGIIFLVHEDTSKYTHSFATGPEMQILDNDRHADGKIIKHRAGDLYDLISVSKETVKPVGEWNLAEIKILNGKLDFYLNGENVVSTTIGDDNWNQLIAGSKFKDWEGFAKYKKGKICLQDHGDKVWYRNVKIKSL